MKTVTIKDLQEAIETIEKQIANKDKKITAINEQILKLTAQRNHFTRLKLEMKTSLTGLQKAIIEKTSKTNI